MGSAPSDSFAPTSCLAGGGQMGALMRAFNWAATPVGPVESWPQSLRTAIGILLGSGYPMYIAWGPRFVQFYNDAYRPILGSTKHPAALGQSTPECFAEVWDFIGPMFRRVLENGDATTLIDQLLPLDRNGYVEECYFTFSYSPIREESGRSGGVFVTVIETTERMLAERRLQTLRELAARGAEARHADEACRIAAGILAANSHDLPFSLLYLLNAGGTRAELAGASGVEVGSPLAPSTLPLDGHSSWPVSEVLQTGKPRLVDDVIARFGRRAAGPWPEPVKTALMLPIAKPGQEQPTGFLIAGISPRRALDDNYATFLGMLAGNIAGAIAHARAYQEEKRRAEVLAALDRAKTTFFGNVSHEFRTPLTLLLAPLEDALDAVPPPVRRHLAVAHRNALRLLKLVNTLLDFSRIEAGRLEASYEPVDLPALTAELASCFRSAIERAGMRLIVDCPALSEPVYVDREMWEKIVLNLLSNAFKFTFEGSITVALRQAGGRAELSVSDTGSGIPAHELPRIFERFHRVQSAQGRTHEGAGIGLALVQELARLHGGGVAAESIPGKGSTFTVSVPLGKAHLPPDRIGGARKLPSTPTAAAAFVEEAARWLPPEPAAAEAASEPRARVLLADDNADMRDYLAGLLGQRYAVEAVPDGLRAFERAVAEPPDLLLTDVMMPGLDGFALLKRLRSEPRTAAVPVILLSARAGDEARTEGLEAGADDYLIKPFTARELLARTGTHLEMGRLRRRMAETLRESQERLRATYDQAPVSMFEIALDGRLSDCNQRFCELTGYRREDLANRQFVDLLHPDDAGPAAERHRTLASGNSFRTRAEVRLVAANRDTIWVDLTATALRDAAGAPKCLLGAAKDITARKLAEQERARLLATERAHTARLRALARVAIEIAGAASARDVLHTITERARQIIGVHAALANVGELQALSLSNEYSSRSGSVEAALVESPERPVRLTREELQAEPASQRAGPRPPLRGLLAAPLRDRHGGHLGAIRLSDKYDADFTEADEAILVQLAEMSSVAINNALLNESLREREERLRALYNQVAAGIAQTDLSGRFVHVNQKFCEIAGRAESVLLGSAFEAIVHPEHVEQHRVIFGRMVREGGEYLNEVRYLRPDGSHAWVTASLSLVTGPEGEPLFAVAVVQDITDRKGLEEKLRHAAKLESLGVLAGGIAHDFNNLLTGVLGNASLLLEETVEQSPAHSLASEIVNAAERAADLTRQMLAYAGKGQFYVEPVDLSNQLHDVTALIQASIPKQVRIELDLAPDLPTIDADAGQLQQLIMNLVINAAEAVGESGGTVRVSTASVRVDDAHPQRMVIGDELTAGEYVRLRVADNGCGMDAATQARIFDPFFTTKFTGRGLGLAAVSGIVRGHRGGLTLTSAPGQGSVFEVLFPASAGQAVAVAAEGRSVKGSGAILVVDDEDVVRRAAAAALRRSGYTVFQASNGLEAIHAFREIAPQASLVILDMTMPVMGGEAALEQLRQIRPDVPVLASSGYSELEALRRFGEGVDGFIQKPYTAAQLTALAGEIINRGRCIRQ